MFGAGGANDGSGQREDPRDSGARGAEAPHAGGARGGHHAGGADGKHHGRGKAGEEGRAEL